MPVDSSIAMSGRQFQLDNPIDVQGKIATLRQLAGQQELQQMQIQQARQTQDQERTLADLYKGNVGADGTINRQGMFTAAAERGLGAKIPVLQKQFADADKATADVKHVGAQTGELEWKVNKGKLEASGAALSSLLANPNVTHDDVIQTTIDLVKRGIIPAEQGQQTIRSLPGDPVRLRQYLVQKGMEVMEAGKRMEMMAPKRQEVNNGKVTSFVDVNPYTNPQGPAPIRMQTTPGQDQSNSTAIRGQNMVDDRAAESNQIKSAEVSMGGKPPPGYRWVGEGKLEAIPGGPGDKLPESQQKQVVGVQNLRNAIREYRSELGNWSNMKGLSPDARAGMGTKYNNMMLQAKEAYNLGVLNGPDLQILTAVITDPRSLTGAVTSNTAMDKQASELDRIMAGIGDTSSNRRPQDKVNAAVSDDIAAILKKHGGK